MNPLHKRHSPPHRKHRALLPRDRVRPKREKFREHRPVLKLRQVHFRKQPLLLLWPKHDLEHLDQRWLDHQRLLDHLLRVSLDSRELNLVSQAHSLDHQALNLVRDLLRQLEMGWLETLTALAELMDLG